MIWQNPRLMCVNAVKTLQAEEAERPPFVMTNRAWVIVHRIIDCCYCDYESDPPRSDLVSNQSQSRNESAKLTRSHIDRLEGQEAVAEYRILLR